MSRFGQVGIAIGALGIMIAIMGLFPGITGVEATPGIGVVQVMMLVVGDALLVFGALIYLKFTFYLNTTANLVQQIGVRLSLTGLVFAAIAGLADILGFGSHLRTESSDILFGTLQAIGLLASLLLTSIGVLIYAVSGEPRLSDESQRNDLDTNVPRQRRTKHESARPEARS